LPYSAKKINFPGVNDFSVDSNARSIRQVDTPTQVTPYQLIGVNLRDSIPVQMPFNTPQYRVTTSLTQEPSVNAYFAKTAAPLQRKTPAATVESIIRYLSATHQYGLSNLPINSPSDPVAYWLASRSSGHCEYFAAALTMLLRADGIPARIVGGFRGGAWNPHGNYLVVLNTDAHAWVEYYDGKAWITADPTPGNRFFDDLDTSSVQPQLPRYAGWRALLDGSRMWWYRHAVTFDAGHDNSWWQQLLGVSRNASSNVVHAGRAAWGATVSWITHYRHLLLAIELPLLTGMLMLYPSITRRCYPQRHVQLQRRFAKKMMRMASPKQTFYITLHRVRYDHPSRWDLPPYFWWKTLTSCLKNYAKTIY
jgi:hypothetical protein